MEKKEQHSMTTSELAKNLDLGVTTIRKYAQYLEKYGYSFQKSASNARLFTKNDAKIITDIKKTREKTNVTVKEAVELVLKKSGKEVADSLPKNHEELDKHIYEIKELLIKQHHIIEELKDRIDTYEEEMNQRLKERDKTLLREMNERLEAQKLIAATTEEETIPEENKTFFRKIFKKHD